MYIKNIDNKFWCGLLCFFKNFLYLIKYVRREEKSGGTVSITLFRIERDKHVNDTPETVVKEFGMNTGEMHRYFVDTA